MSCEHGGDCSGEGYEERGGLLLTQPGCSSWRDCLELGVRVTAKPFHALLSRQFALLPTRGSFSPTESSCGGTPALPELACGGTAVSSLVQSSGPQRLISALLRPSLDGPLPWLFCATAFLFSFVRCSRPVALSSRSRFCDVGFSQSPGFVCLPAPRTYWARAGLFVLSFSWEGGLSPVLPGSFWPWDPGLAFPGRHLCLHRG